MYSTALQYDVIILICRGNICNIFSFLAKGKLLYLHIYLEKKMRLQSISHVVACFDCTIISLLKSFGYHLFKHKPAVCSF